MPSKKRITQTYLDTLNLLSNLVEGRDPYTAGHTWRVSRYAVAMARQLGWDRKKRSAIELGAAFHDLGKIATEDRILRKAGPLVEEEFEQMKVHPVEGKRLLQGIEMLRPAIVAIYAHHERYNGSGYPEGLRGKEIPAEGRLVAVADVFDALTSNRPYRRPGKVEEALAYLEGQQGILFDPEMVDALRAAWQAGELEKTVLHSEGHIPLLECPAHGPTIAVSPSASQGDETFCPVCKTRFVLVKAKEGWQAQLL
ncbi:MAG: HD-GYP domain-containing protein [Candidatus Manganitrophus sp. SA1]|nr:HD-GYP domain-containing protein [Candidatus Manganitrophus morganii]